MSRRTAGNELQTFVTKLSINKLLTTKYENRRFFRARQSARKGKYAVEAQGVVVESRKYMDVYTQNSVEGRKELREDLIVQLKKQGNNKQARILEAA